MIPRSIPSARVFAGPLLGTALLFLPLASESRGFEARLGTGFGMHFAPEFDPISNVPVMLAMGGTYDDALYIYIEAEKWFPLGEGISDEYHNLFDNLLVWPVFQYRFGGPTVRWRPLVSLGAGIGLFRSGTGRYVYDCPTPADCGVANDHWELAGPLKIHAGIGVARSLHRHAGLSLEARVISAGYADELSFSVLLGVELR